MEGGQPCVSQHDSAPRCRHTPSSLAPRAEQKSKARARQLFQPTESRDVSPSHHPGAPGPCHGLPRAAAALLRASCCTKHRHVATALRWKRDKPLTWLVRNIGRATASSQQEIFCPRFSPLLPTTPSGAVCFLSVATSSWEGGWLWQGSDRWPKDIARQRKTRSRAAAHARGASGCQNDPQRGYAGVINPTKHLLREENPAGESRAKLL